MPEELLRVENLKKYFNTKRGLLHAVDGITFSIEKGKTLGLVGESGCGKSTTGRLIMRLIEPTDGKIKFNGKDVIKANKNEMHMLRRDMQIIFQDPFSSLNPRKSIYELISEPLRWFNICKNKGEEKERIESLMETVGLARRLIGSYPHELDGGRRQRIGVARALALEPKFIVCDEPVSALDVSIQAQIINLLEKLQSERGITYLFITHDLSVVNYFSNDIAVMYLGMIVEKAPAVELFENPLHPYTKALLSAIPSIDVDQKRDRILLKGEISSPINPADQCRFAKRCNYAQDICLCGTPQLREVSPGHFLSCAVM
ncbi:MAG TPA: ABC transporter ATP-binding protein [Bacillota bacterium]|nr:ABC transporter ATP-binding protein [Bacillota bacterium]